MENNIKKCDLAIIVPVLNCLEYTRSFIQKLKIKRDYRLIVINNGSTDGTMGYLKYYSRTKEITIIDYPQNMGVAYAWNTGIKYAIENFDSKYFFIPNNDIILYPKTVERMIEAFDNKDVVLTTALNINNGEPFPDNIDKIDDMFGDEITEKPDFSCFMISKECVEKVGMFDENFYPAYFEDNDYHYRIKKAGLKAIKTNRAVFYHFGSQTIKNDEKIRNFSNKKYLDNKEYFIKKWGGCPGNEIFDTPFGE